MLFIGMLTLSIIIFLQGKSFVPTACYFLIMAAIIEVMIIEGDQYKLKEMEIQNLKSKQANWIHKELNQACESNDIEDIKKTLYSLDSKLYSSHYQNNIQKEEPENSTSIAQSKEWIEKEDIEYNFERAKKEEFVEMQENKQQKYDTQNKIEEIKLQIDVLSDLSKKFTSKPDPFEKRILSSYGTHLRIALDSSIDALDVVQLFIDSPLKKATLDRHDTVLNSISVNVKEIALHLSIYDSFYPLKKQYSLKDIIYNLNQTLRFMVNAERDGMLLTSSSAEANQNDFTDNGLQSSEKKTERVKIIGNIEDFLEPDISMNDSPEEIGVYQDFCHSLGDMIREDYFKIKEIPQELRLMGGSDLYRKAFLNARGHSDVERYLLNFRVLLNDIKSLKENDLWKRKDAISLVVDELINGLDFFKEDKAIVEFLYENKEGLKKFGIFYDPKPKLR
ncbi:hypothetical protein ACN9TC_12965 [Lactococcus lactis]